MPAYARSEIVDESQVGVYHCIARCVRRAFLCGIDHYTGNNFDHRKTWVQQRLEELAGIFSIDILGFAVLSNHIHLLVRNRPDVAEVWSDDEVARRWWRLHPKRRNDDGSPAQPEPCDLAAIGDAPERLALLRRRLASLSWLMASLCEPIARRANHEDHCSGRFFDGRFRCQAIIDEAALLACSIYVDLNPIRACLADTPESSEFTAAFERIAARSLAEACLTPSAPAAESAAQAECDANHAADAWLSPIPDADVPARLHNPSVFHSTRRASDRGFLPMTLDEYLELLDWTGRQIRADKRGAIPADLRPILERLQVNAEAWVDTIARFGRSFRRTVGRASSMAELAAHRGKCWYQGVTASKLAFG